MIEIRSEELQHVAEVRELNLLAFDNGPEADLADLLRSVCKEYMAFVAVENHQIVGHIVFTPVSINEFNVTGMGLAPMAVSPGRQRQGIGSKLVRHGLEVLKTRGCPFVIVLGHPQYYPRFGFIAASEYKLQCQWEGVPDEAFLVIVYDHSIIPANGGVARYRNEFNSAM